MTKSATLMLFLMLGFFLGACKTAERASDAGGASTAAMTMEEDLIAKNIEAQGGLAALKDVESLQMIAEVYMPMAGMSMPLTIYQKRPLMMRSEVSVAAMNMEVIGGFDGETAWADNPMQGGLQKLSGEQARSVREQADIDGVLIDHEAKGYTVSFVGEESVRDVNTKKLKVMRPDSSEIFVYLDAETFMQVKVEGEAVNPMTGSGTVKVETYTSDFKDTAGVMRPYLLEVMMDGQLFQKITVSEIKTNVEIDDTVFAYPKK